ncbi:peptidoglycan recognition protein [Streptomyces sp. NPDC127072]|uniref:peptidoglycan recognition protein family protein n=1 Tax=Streptomyces sp. NPDC127072 TaxID=3347129 RepID=UPI00365F5C1D
MRGFLVSSVGVTCAAALALPLALPAPAQARPSAVTSGPAVPGSTQSLPLAPLGGERALGSGALEQGLTRRDVRPFSLVGIVWDDPAGELRGRVQVRTRAVATGHWSGWQDVDTHNHEHAPDPGTAEAASSRVRGSTAPLWVGDSDGVEVRVQAEADARATAAGDSLLPRGMRLELVAPGADAAPAGARPDVRRAGAPQGLARGETQAHAPRASALSTAHAPESADTTDLETAASGEVPELASNVIPALSQLETEAEFLAERPAGDQRVKPHIGPRPRIVTRKGWGANEKLRERGFVYSKRVKAAFVHHTASGNNYRCSQVPSVIRSIYRYHVVSSGWRDIGYNFLVDRCGNIYEGRAGGVAKAVTGAHTLGFNTDSMGIAVLGSFGKTKPSKSAVTAIAKLTAWKLGLFGVNPRGKTYLKSGGGNLYKKGKNVRLNVISGHRDGFSTECPGWQMYTKLGTARKAAAKYQGR